MQRLFDGDFVKRVAALRWAESRRGARSGSGSAGATPGARGFELAGHRPYGEGDDLRALDWNALARLDQPVIRRFKDAEPRELWFLIDRSPSMQFGTPSKDVMARRLAGALGILALASGAGTGVLGEGMAPRSPHTFLVWLERLSKTANLLTREPSVVSSTSHPREWILLCDPYEIDTARRLLTLFRRTRDSVFVVLITADQDRNPPRQDSVVVDSESRERRTYSAADAEEFEARRAALLGAWKSLAKLHHATLTEVDCAQSWESAAAALLEARAATRSS